MTSPLKSPGGDRWWVTAGLSAGAAIVFVLAFPPVNLGPAIVFAPLFLTVAAAGAVSTRRVASFVFLSQWALWLWMQRWMVDVTAFGYPALSAYQAFYPMIYVWAIRRAWQSERCRRLPFAALVAVLWVATEMLRGTVAFNGYPWFLTAHPLIVWPVLVQSADLFGTYFVGFLAALSGGVAAEIWLSRVGQHKRLVFRPGVGAAAALIVCSIAYGFFRLSQTACLTPGPVILAIQTNLPQDNKTGWSLERQRIDVPEFIGLTLTAFDESGVDVDLVVWPETMVPGFGFDPETTKLLEQVNSENAVWHRALFGLQEHLGTPLLVGSPRRVGVTIEEAADGYYWKWEKVYNSAFLLDGDAFPQRYDKVFLTPFGETMPYISAWPWLERQMLALGAPTMSFSLDAGEDYRQLALKDSEGAVGFGTPICFEDTVSSACRRMLWNNGRRTGEFLINLSNDGWFGGHDAGRLQHLQAARFRCVENRVPMVRTVNTGQSIHIDSRGKLVESSGPGRSPNMRSPGWLVAETTLDARQPLFGRIGDLWGWICLGGAVLLVGRTFSLRKTEQQNEQVA